MWPCLPWLSDVWIFLIECSYYRVPTRNSVVKCCPVTTFLIHDKLIRDLWTDIKGKTWGGHHLSQKHAQGGGRAWTSPGHQGLHFLGGVTDKWPTSSCFHQDLTTSQNVRWKVPCWAGLPFKGHCRWCSGMAEQHAGIFPGNADWGTA